MSAYADIFRVQAILDAEAGPDPDRFDALNATASAELDAACRVTGFGTDPAPRTLTFCAGTAAGYPEAARWPGPALTVVLDPPALTASAVSDNGDPLDAATYRLVWRSFDRYAGLARTDAGYWGATIAVTGDFADLPPGPVPPEIVEAASVLVAGYLRRDRMPAGEVSGPEGLTFRPSNPWGDERVKRAIARYRIPPLTV